MASSPVEALESGVDQHRFDGVSGLFSSLDKALKGMQLYQGEGSLVERLLDDLEQRAIYALKDGEVTVRVASFGLVFGGRPLFADDKRRGYLFRLFCDGVRELTLQPGIDRAELRALMNVLNTDPKAGQDDVVTLLWKAELRHVHLYVADTFAAGMEVSNEGELTLARGGMRERLEQAEDAESLALSSDDVRMLRIGEQLAWLAEARTSSVPDEEHRDLVQNVQAAFQTRADMAHFISVALQMARREAAEGGEMVASQLVLGQYDAVLEKGDAESVSELLDAVGRAAATGDEAARVLRDTLLESERARRLAPLYIRNPQQLLERLSAMAEGAQAGLVTLLSELPPGEPQVQLQEALTKAGVDLTPFYSRQLQVENEGALVAAVEALARIGSTESYVAIAKVLAINITGARTAALKALVGHYHESARTGLSRALRDPSRENRFLALEVLKRAKEPRVAWSLVGVLEDPSFEERDAEEQEAIYLALAAFRDDRTLDHFKETLAKKNLLRKGNLVNRQLLAVKALQQVNTEAANQILQEAAGAWYLPGKVKAAIAARGGKK